MKTLFVAILLCSVSGILEAQQAVPLKSLKIGNFWVYRYDDESRPLRPDIKGNAYERVVGTQTINGREYAQVYNSYFRSYSLERSDSNNVYVWDGSKEIRTHSISWNEGDTISLHFYWHGCNGCKYIISAIYKRFNTFLKDTTYAFALRDVVLRLPKPVSPYVIYYVRKYFVNQLDSNGLNSREMPDGLGGTYLKGAYINGVVLNDTNIITSVTDPEPLVQSKQGGASTQGTAPRVAIAMSAENPFTTRTQVRYRLEKAGNVELAVYNTQGVRLTTVFRATQGAGEHTAVWNGTNAEGQDVPTGAYFLVVFVNDRQVGEVKVMKMR